MNQKLWRKKSVYALCIGWFLLAGCIPKLYIKESFREAVVLPVSESTIALNRGESIDIAAILKKEKVKPEKVVLTRLLGRYILTGEGFRHIWILQPSGQHAATYHPLAMPDKTPLQNPKFAHSEAHNCVALGLNNNAPTWHIHISGRIARSCSDVDK